jgi:hypothetical protein
MILTIQYYLGLGEGKKDAGMGARILRLNTTQVNRQQSLGSKSKKLQKNLSIKTDMMK